MGLEITPVVANFRIRSSPPPLDMKVGERPRSPSEAIDSRSLAYEMDKNLNWRADFVALEASAI